jgi:predicted phosphodiesterase
MRFLILSDLHLEFAPFDLSAKSSDYDAVILAGDILPGAEELLAWAGRLAQADHDKPVIVVPGNHEYYGGVLQEQRRQMRQAAASNVHVLESDG